MGEFEVVDEPGRRVAVVRSRVPVGELTAVFGAAFGTVAAALEAAGASVTGAPFGWYHDVPAQSVDVSVGFPFDRAAPAPGPDAGRPVEVAERPGRRAVVGVHVGPYDELDRTYGELTAWAAGRGLRLGAGMWEEYLTGPEEAPPQQWRTRIVVPLAG